MCYPKPGPRCSNHALKKFESANQAVVAARASRDEQKLIAATAEYNEAKKDYLMTPAGQKYLQSKITQTGDPGGVLQKALDKSVRERRAALKRAKMTDVGDMDNHNQKAKPTEAEMTAADRAYAEKVQNDKQRLSDINEIRKAQGLVPLSSVNSIRLDGDTRPRATYGDYDTAKIPQANDVGKMSSAVDAIGNGATTSKSIAESLGVDHRQGNYYATAAEYVGLLEKSQKGDSNEHEYHLTHNGEVFRQAEPEQRQAMLKELVNATPVMETYRESGYNKAVLQEDIKMSGYDETTAKRRASTVVAWHEKLNSSGFTAELSGAQKAAVERSKVAAEKQRQEREEKARQAKEEATKQRDFGYCDKHGIARAGDGSCEYCD